MKLHYYKKKYYWKERDCSKKKLDVNFCMEKVWRPQYLFLHLYTRSKSISLSKQILFFFLLILPSNLALSRQIVSKDTSWCDASNRGQGSGLQKVNWTKLKLYNTATHNLVFMLAVKIRHSGRWSISGIGGVNLFLTIWIQNHTFRNCFQTKQTGRQSCKMSLSPPLLRNEMLILVTGAQPRRVGPDYAAETRLPHCFSGILVLHVNRVTSC